MTKQIIAQQGEVLIIKVDSLPDTTTKPVEKNHQGLAIVSHSENGNHHVLTGGVDVLERTEKVPAGMRVLQALLKEPQQLKQDAQVPHEPVNLPPGFYEFRISREYDPFSEQARIVAD